MATKTLSNGRKVKYNEGCLVGDEAAEVIKANQAKRDAAPYVPGGNRPFSIFADTSKDRPALVNADWLRERIH